MSIQQTAWHETDHVSRLTAEFADWRIGRGGSGHWWAVRGNELVRTLDVDELRVRLRALDPDLAPEPGLG
ncbi:hypothetical protein [Actinomadura hibisca]|uniref:hypothetical protein n=1 Tax=Actinomadura hibisca TaxID=68565 RepID=UPI00082C1CB0|nr:hypothetical protein [Actinomadura hibisca]